MLKECLEMFGHEDLQLGVEVSNVTACHIYKKLGFKIVRNLNVPGLGPCYWMQRSPQDNSNNPPTPNERYGVDQPP
jgi:hypothetical protein